MPFKERLFFPTGFDGIARSNDHRNELPGVGFNHVEAVVVDAGLVAASFVVVVILAVPRTGANVAWGASIHKDGCILSALR